MNYEKICAGIKATRKKYLTQQEAAELCHLSKKTIYKLERSGVLPYEEHVNQLIHTHKVKTTDVLIMLRNRYCQQSSRSGYIKTMTSYYKKLLQKEPDTLELSDIIRLTGFSKSGVLNWLLRGKLKSIRSGRFYLVPNRYLLGFLLSPYYRTIKNKSIRQKEDMAEIERCYHNTDQAGDGDE